MNNDHILNSEDFDAYFAKVDANGMLLYLRLTRVLFYYYNCNARALSTSLQVLKRSTLGNLIITPKMRSVHHTVLLSHVSRLSGTDTFPKHANNHLLVYKSF